MPSARRQRGSKKPALPPSPRERGADRGHAPAGSPSVGFVSLGCAKNRVDSQVMAGVLLAEGLRLAASPEEADVVLVNTCSFIDEARAESMQAIRDVCRLKRAGRCRAVLVTGCLPQRYRAELLRELPGVDALIGVDELDGVGRIARRLLAGERGVVEIAERSQRLFDPSLPGLAFTAGRYAYLKIAEGCDHPCAFCAIPGIRGRHRSRTVDSVVREAAALLGQGFRELNLISQDVTAYGRDLGDGTDLAALLLALGRLGGDFWMRILYAYPTGLTDRLLATMAAVPQVCRYLDVPVQHSHPDILKAMRRGATAVAVRDLPARARRAMPDIALRTTCLVGYPGEREEHVAHLLDYVRATRFDHLGVFVYSPEEGTAAAALPGRPARRTAARRRARLLEAQHAIVAGQQAVRVGSADVVLLDRLPGPGRRAPALAHARFQAPEVDGCVRIAGLPAGARVGDFARVQYTGAADYDMNARALA